MSSEARLKADVLGGILTILKRQQYIQLSSTTILVYDHLLTLGDEVRTVWRYDRNWICSLFLVTRYGVPLLFFVETLTLYPVWTLESCRAFVNSHFSVLAVIATLSRIMILRTYALCKQRKWVLILLGILWVVMVLIMVTTNLFIGRPVNLPDFVIPLTGACLMGNSISKISAFFYTGVLLVDTVILFLTVWQTSKLLTMKNNNHSGLKLLKLYMKDGVLFYAVVCCAHLTNVLFIILAPDSLKPAPGNYSQSITSILVCRLVLRLRKAGEKQKLRKQNATTSTAEPVFSNTSQNIASFFNAPLENHSHVHTLEDQSDEGEGYSSDVSEPIRHSTSPRDNRYQPEWAAGTEEIELEEFSCHYREPSIRGPSPNWQLSYLSSTFTANSSAYRERLESRSSVGILPPNI
ncbi:hypothetical protein M422DRAFT_41998 [Sphaerobolus stellatus SS14]|nr:hypothetical protein M422DRAFT_41998 [Sphaerobolus stellatus SS14]